MNPKKVLVIEDDPDIRKNMQLLLELEGYEVLSATNGLEAWELLQATSDLPSAILLDLMMPIMDGFEFREKQKQDPRLAAIPVAIMTADGRIEEKQIRCSAKAALKKPADIDSILSLVNEMSSPFRTV